jgi:hypothetical protein
MSGVGFPVGKTSAVSDGFALNVECTAATRRRIDFCLRCATARLLNFEALKTRDPFLARLLKRDAPLVMDHPSWMERDRASSKRDAFDGGRW